MGVYGQTNGGSTPVSTGGKGTSMALPAAWNHPSPQAGFGGDYGATAGGMQPVAQMPPRQNYAYQQQPAWLSALASILQRQQPQAYRYQAPTYSQMTQQALPQGWQAPPPVYTPPPPPKPAPAPEPAVQPNVQAQIYDPGYYAAGRAAGGRIEERGSAHSPSDVVERALAVLLRREIDE